MKRNKPSLEFWTILSAVNVAGVIYPFRLLLQASSADENFFAICVLVGTLFLIAVVDAVAIVVAGVVGIGKS